MVPTGLCVTRHTYLSLSHCFDNDWAVFVGVPLPQLPTLSSLRVSFFLDVCVCYTISTVFQAFFVSLFQSALKDVITKQHSSLSTY